MRESAVNASGTARALSLLALALCFCGRAAAAEAPLNVVIVLWDSARYDHTTPAGYFRDTTPNLAALAAQGLFFTNAFSQSNWTMPAVASLFTGLRPPSHGVVGPGDKLPEQIPTLADAFRAKGFRTGAFTAGFIHGIEGYNRGFDVARSFQLPKQSLSSIKDPQEAALEWLKESPDKPFFLFIHGADAHYPYSCPPASRRLFGEKVYAGPALAMKVDHSFVAAYDRYFEPDFLRILKLSDWERAQSVISTPADKGDLIAQYDGCLSYADSLLPRLTDGLAELKLADNTAVIVLSDHGEALGGHGGYGHITRPLYDNVSRIVLAMRLPGSAQGRRVAAPIELIDLMPTLLELQNWQAPAGVEGRSLAGLLRGGELSPAPALWSSAASRPAVWPKRLDLQALRYGDWKVLRSADGWALYNLKTDPGEKSNLLPGRPKVFLDMAARLLSLSLQQGQVQSETGKPENMTAARREIMEAEQRVAAAEVGKERELLSLASLYEHNGDLAALERLCLAGLETFPREEGFTGGLAKVYLKEGRWTQLAALRKKRLELTALKPLNGVLELASALVLAGSYKEAEETLRQAAAVSGVAADSEILRDRLTLVGRLKSAAKAGPRQDTQPVVFGSYPQGRTVSRPPWLLKYSAADNKFTLERGGLPAAAGQKELQVASILAQRLLDHVEEKRFAEAPPAAAVQDDLAEKLKAAGYLAAD